MDERSYEDILEDEDIKSLSDRFEVLAEEHRYISHTAVCIAMLYVYV